MNQDSVSTRLEAAFQALYENDINLIEMNAGERVIAARLAFYLQGLFPTYNVDVEYNRHGVDPKSIHLGPECGHEGENLIVPDIVIHRRGNDDYNILVLEIKKSTNPIPRDCDVAKLNALKQQYHYLFAAFIQINTGQEVTTNGYEVQWM